MPSSRASATSRRRNECVAWRGVDRAIVDANQVVAYYNHVNRVADSLDVELEPSWPAEVRHRRPYPLLDQLPTVGADELPG
jgi:hypothetical protein